MWHPEHPESALPFDPEAAEKKMFPYGKIGDIRYDPYLDKIIIIVDCEVEHHKHTGEEHEHVYIPAIAGVLYGGKYMLTGIEFPEKLITIEELTNRLKEEAKQNERHANTSRGSKKS